MDQDRFDALARHLSTGLTRRRALSVLGGSLIAAFSGIRNAAAQSCASPLSPCGNRCHNLLTDDRHCGDCNNRCPPHQTCQAGICACPAGESPCNNRCLDLQSDDRNCGGCQVRCPAGATCQAGVCTCPPGEKVCRNRCQNVTSDRNNCGDCDVRCPPGATCQGGTCICPPGQDACTGRCVNLQMNADHCGDCNAPCSPPFGFCLDGACRCSAGLNACFGDCVSLQTDTANCGTCGNSCPDGVTCVAGSCTCPNGQTLCFGQCVDLQTDNATCGDCTTACPDGIDCVGGVCSCPDGQIVCGGGCFDPTTDRNHCGGCGISCPGDDTCSVCEAGVCQVTCDSRTCPDACRFPCDACPSEPGIYLCEIDSDCLSGNCNGNNCEYAESCFNGIQDGLETGVDCGGGPCPACDGAQCLSNADCASRACRTGTCQAPSCSDGIANGRESDVDCGGPSSGCVPCPDSFICSDDLDCESGFCNPSGLCSQNTCTDGEINGNETDIDCGGPDCPPCVNGFSCFVDGDCLSEFCDLTDNTCRTSGSCSDGIRNGEESDIDCGGPSSGCAPCADGRACFSDSDCESTFCSFSGGDLVCASPTCNDGAINGFETDFSLDSASECGGPECPPCEDGQRCRIDDDCISGLCNEAGICGDCPRPCFNSTFGDLVDCCLETEFCSASGSCFPCSISPISCQ